MKAARFVIFPSRWYEPFGMGLIEAAGCGVPVSPRASAPSRSWSSIDETGTALRPAELRRTGREGQWAWAHRGGDGSTWAPRPSASICGLYGREELRRLMDHLSPGGAGLTRSRLSHASAGPCLRSVHRGSLPTAIPGAHAERSATEDPAGCESKSISLERRRLDQRVEPSATDCSDVPDCFGSLPGQFRCNAGTLRVNRRARRPTWRETRGATRGVRAANPIAGPNRTSLAASFEDSVPPPAALPLRAAEQMPVPIFLQVAHDPLREPGGSVQLAISALQAKLSRIRLQTRQERAHAISRITEELHQQCQQLHLVDAECRLQLLQEQRFPDWAVTQINRRVPTVSNPNSIDNLQSFFDIPISRR